MEKLTKETAKNFYELIEKEDINCPVCNSDKSNHYELYIGDRYGMDIRTVGCKDCGMIFLNPRPTQMTMVNFYANDYRKFYETVDKPTSEYVKQGPFIPRAQYVLKQLKQNLPVDYSGKALDIGCAEGTLLKHIGDEFTNLELYGLEPNSNFVEYARKNTRAKKIFISDFQSLFDNITEKYTLITMTHVLEHILDPLDVLISIKNILEPEGYFYVEVPNVMDIEAKGLGNIHIGHVLSFYPEPFRQVLTRAGFEVVEFYQGDLPAQTKAMAALCKVNTENMKQFGVVKVQEKFDSYINRICITEKRCDYSIRNFLRQLVGKILKEN